MEPHHHRQLYPDYAGSNERPFHTRLDASGDREVVYCHACAAEWHRDEFGIICPECESEATEIVSPDNDPREEEDGPEELPDFGSAHGHFETHHGDFATGEAPPNVNFQLRPDGAFFYNHTIWDGSRPQGSNGLQERQAHDPSGDDVMRQFYDLMNNITGPRPGHLHPPGVGAGAEGQDDDDTRPRARMTTTVFSRGPISVTRTEFRGPTQASGTGDDMRTIPFPALFGTFLSDVGPPPVGSDGRPTGHRTGVGASLTEILNMFVNPSGRHGDAVHSQEALDQIITQLMEANPQSNAAPPASDAALRNLPRKTVDDTMLQAEGGAAECTICIDSLNKGDTVLVLPCKHWFHEACVTMWLKEHNTCPICRTPMESRGGHSPAQGGTGDSDGGNHQGPDNASHQPNSHGSGSDPSAEEGRSTRAGLFSPWNFIGGGGGPGGHQSAMAPPSPSSFSSRRRVFTDNFTSSSSTPNPESHRLPRFNRTDTSTSERIRPSAHVTTERSASFRSPRRDSRSPTSPDPARPTRVRSPHHSASSSRDRAEGGSSHNPLTWLRHAMDRQSSSGSAPARDGGSSRRHY